MVWFLTGLIGCLLIISSVLSATETAIVAASPGRIQKKKLAGNKRVKLLLTLMKNKDKVISTLLIANSIVVTVSTTIATGVIIELVGEERGTIIASAVMSLLIIIFGEVLPKAIAVSKAETIALTTAPLINFAILVMTPMNLSLNYVVRGFCYIFKINLKSDVSATEEVRGVIEHYHQEGNVKKTDRDMLGGVLNLRQTTIAEVMVHRSQVVTINSNLPISEITTQALDTPHTRIPLWQGTKDNIIGILYIRNLLKALHKNNFDYSKLSLKDFINEPWFVPENTLLSKQLNEFRARRSHIAIVVDEYGDILGILTLEDILEEIVGEIDDEYDKIHHPIASKGENRYIVEGSTSIRDINRELNINLPYEEAHTLAGLIMHMLERLPNLGEQVELKNIRLSIVKKQSHQIKSILVEILPQVNDEYDDNR